MKTSQLFKELTVQQGDWHTETVVELQGVCPADMGHGSAPCGHKEGPRQEGVCPWTRLLSRCEGMACAKAWG